MAMTRIETEKAILEKMKEIKDIYLGYCQDGEYLALSIIKDTVGITIMANNGYSIPYHKKHEGKTPVDFHYFERNGEGKLFTFEKDGIPAAREVEI